MQLTAEPEDAGKRLDLLLHERLPQYSRSRLQEWIRNGRVLVNGAAGRASRQVHAGDRIDVEPGGGRPAARYSGRHSASCAL